MTDIYLYDAIRTARGKGKSSGSLHSVTPLKLLADVLKNLAHKHQLNTASVEDVSIGCVTQAQEQGACIARTALLEANYNEKVPGVTMNRFCGSGLEAVHDIAAKIGAGFCDLGIAGGVESMSRVPMGSDGGALLDPRMALRHGLVPQGISADLLATLHDISREDVDLFALQSQQKAAHASQQGWFKNSVIPMYDESNHLLLDHDEYIRASTSLEGLQKLKPAFLAMGEHFGLDTLTRRKYPYIEKIRHVHTAGNSSGIVDGAAAVLLGNAEAQDRHQLKARARIKSAVTVGSDPVLMLSGPVPAAQAALKKAKMTLADIDLFEVNEAFAAVPLYFMQALNIDASRVNMNGGAIALGHPLGATGSMLLGTALDLLEQKDLNTALITLCIGGGMGIATIIERV